MMNERKSRPIPDAANEFQQLAADARTMLADFQAGWLWKLLTIKTHPIPEVSEHQKEPSDAT